MGSPADELGRRSDETQHEVTLTRDFYLQVTEVTQAQWVEVMGSNPSYFSGCDECPVEYISRDMAVDYCNTLSASEDLEPAYEVDGGVVSWKREADGYRLPTESEWEYACRAGSSTAFYNGDIITLSCLDPNLGEIGWNCGNASSKTHPVGEKRPNAWGLYDMSGNVWEWCWDFYGSYPPSPVTDPTGPASGTRYIKRGGAWRESSGDCRSAGQRSHDGHSYREHNLGMRPARWVR